MQYGRRVIAGMVVVACATLGAQQSRSSWSGVYTAAQAAAGEKVYFEKCASCHGPDLGGIERAPALAGGAFLNAWHGQDLRRLLRSEEHTSELQSQSKLVCRLLLEKKKKTMNDC